MVNEKEVQSELSVTYVDEDKWPLRVGELIVDLVERCASQTEEPTVEIATYLDGVLAAELPVHVSCVITSETDPAGITEYTVKSSVAFDDLRCVLARAASERCNLSYADLVEVSHSLD